MAVAYRAEIDGLRAIAISSVVLFHAGQGIAPGGFVGVDIFFVISGYLITSIIWAESQEGRFSYLNFYARRARRILPALLFMLVIVTLVSFAILLPGGLIEYGKVLIYTVTFAANFRLAAASDYFEAWSGDNPLLHMWSLAVEEQFYFVWPALLCFLAASLSTKRLRLAVILLAASSLLASEVLVHLWPRSAFFHLPSRGWELLAGALLALKIAPPIRKQPIAEALSGLGLAAMIGSVLVISRDTPFPGIAAVPAVLGCAMVIHAETHANTLTGRILSLKPLVLLGLISYSLYLWHWPCLSLPRAVLFRELTEQETLSCVALAGAFSVFSWRFVELPFRRRYVDIRTAATSNHGLFLNFGKGFQIYAPLALTILLIFCGSYFQRSSGASWRLSASAKELMPSTRSGDCILRSRQRIVCNFGTSGGDLGAFVLWGDSQADRYLPALLNIFGSGSAFLFPGCPPVLGGTRVGTAGKPVYPNCRTANETTVEAILKARPGLVIIAAGWTAFEDSPYGLEKLGNAFFVRNETDPLSRQFTHEVFREELRRTISLITSTGSHVVLMAQVPEMKRNVLSCAIASRHLGLSDERCKTIQRREVETRQAFINGTLASLAEEITNVTIFWPMPQLCDGQFCYAYRDGRFIYDDGGHLNLEGALLLQDAIKKTLAEAPLLQRQKLPISASAPQVLPQ